MTLRLETLDGRILPSVVSGDLAITHPSAYLMASASGAGGDIIRNGPTGDGIELLGTGYKPGTTGDVSTGVDLCGGGVRGGDISF
jgi:hypothetical protein